jgi:hypothetical protein
MKRVQHRFRTLIAVLPLIAGCAVLTASPAAAATFGQSSDARPGIAYAGGTVYVAWAGTDSGHTLNIGALAFNSSGAFNGWASINTFSGLQTYPGTGPSITAASVSGFSGSQILAAWTDKNGRLTLTHYVGTTTLSCLTALDVSSHHSPYLISIGSTVYLAWTALDSHVKIARLTSNLCSTSATVVTLGDTATAGPAITTDGTNIFVAWPGTNAGNNIWAGRYVGTASLASHTCFCSYASTDDVGLTLSYNAAGGLLSYHGTNNRLYLLSVTMDNLTASRQAGRSTAGPPNTAPTSPPYRTTTAMSPPACTTRTLTPPTGTPPSIG